MSAVCFKEYFVYSCSAVCFKECFVYTCSAVCFEECFVYTCVRCVLYTSFGFTQKKKQYPMVREHNFRKKIISIFSTQIGISNVGLFFYFFVHERLLCQLGLKSDWKTFFAHLLFVSRKKIPLAVRAHIFPWKINLEFFHPKQDFKHEFFTIFLLQNLLFQTWF